MPVLCAGPAADVTGRPVVHDTGKSRDCNTIDSRCQSLRVQHNDVGNSFADGPAPSRHCTRLLSRVVLSGYPDILPAAWPRLAPPARCPAVPEREAPMIRKVQRRWMALVRATWWPTVPVLVVQMVSGIWYMPQLSFVPIRLDRQLRLRPVLISTLF